MKYIVVVVMMLATNSYSQMEFSSAKFKAIPPLDTGIKTKK
jgi:hypothetical protein